MKKKEFKDILIKILKCKDIDFVISDLYYQECWSLKLTKTDKLKISIWVNDEYFLEYSNIDEFIELVFNRLMMDKNKNFWEILQGVLLGMLNNEQEYISDSSKSGDKKLYSLEPIIEAMVGGELIDCRDMALHSVVVKER